MKCRFDYTQRYETVIFILLILLALSLFSVMFFSFPELSVGALRILFLVIFAVIIGTVLVISAGRKGVIRADDSKISISHLFFRRNVFIWNIPYEDVEYVLCQVNARAIANRAGRSSITYTLVLTIKINDRSEMNFIKDLKFKNDFPAAKSEKFNKYINEQPLMKMCEYINERTKLL